MDEFIPIVASTLSNGGSWFVEARLEADVLMNDGSSCLTPPRFLASRLDDVCCPVGAA